MLVIGVSFVSFNKDETVGSRVAHFGHRDQRDRSIVITAIGDGDRSAATLGRRSAIELGPGMARFRPGVSEAEVAAGDIERPLELWATVGEDTPHRPAGALEVRHDDLAQERGGSRGVVGRQQTRKAVGGRRIMAVTVRCRQITIRMILVTLLQDQPMSGSQRTVRRSK
jgi:hypothetical protein